jgi:DNA polymerase-3 subunit alpha (Gram-positive type)
MCEVIKKTTGQHPGGIMIVPKDKEIYDFSPIQRPADSKGTDIITTHFDCKFLHECILKIDILGHDDPTILKMLHDLTGVDPRTVEIGEKNTMRIFSELSPLGVTKDEIMSDVGTYGIPEFGTKFVREMLKETRPTKISELVRISGLSHGADVWIGNAQKLISSGQATLSEAICCRDDITIYLIHKELPPQVAFRISESVRKGKGLTDEEEKIMREHNVPGWYIDSCKKISYMFPKAHAVAYVMMAFRIAWYKVNYPEAFYAAYFSVRAGDAFDANIMTKGRETVLENIKNLVKKGNEITAKEKDTLSVLEIVNEMYARGLKFCPVDLYESDVKNFKITPDGLLPPFVALPGLGPNAAANIVASRQKAKFLSKEDLMKRASIGKSVLEILEKSDCLSELEDSNQMNLF